jgi:hypothetical protein
MLKTVDKVASIPKPEQFPAWTVEFYTDAAGGSLSSAGAGTGGLGGPFGSRRINCGMKGKDKKRLCRKLSALELVGPLICISAGRRYCKLKPVQIWVDNAGSVGIWKKKVTAPPASCAPTWSTPLLGSQPPSAAPSLQKRLLDVLTPGRS